MLPIGSVKIAMRGSVQRTGPRAIHRKIEVRGLSWGVEHGIRSTLGLTFYPCWEILRSNDYPRE